MTRKTILLLGAAKFQIPPIDYALSAGHRVITADNRPRNPGHALAHASYNVSTLDIDGILRIAEQESIDGILTFGSDVSASTAAVVARELGLPGNSPESVDALSKKHLFRERLRGAGIDQMCSAHFSSRELDDAVRYARSFETDVVVKPADSSGSRGVSIWAPQADLTAALADAASHSGSGIVVEERVPRLGYQICGDGWFQDGSIAFVQYGNGHFLGRPDRLAPYGETFPSAHPTQLLDTVTMQLEAALRACAFTGGPFNLDVLVDARDRRPFIIEIGPRSGGNYLPTAIRYQSGVDMIAAAVENCLDAGFRLHPEPGAADGFHSCFMLHASDAGPYDGFSLHPDFPGEVLEVHPYVERGDHLHPFVSANHAVGNLILRFEDYDTMLKTMDEPDRVATLS